MTDPRCRAPAVRQAFLDFFASRPSSADGHTLVPSAPVVPHDDPTLLFTNAGMNQFKPLFLNQVQPGSPLEGLSRAANSQKCIRAGGKHNDLDDVGKDTYHHTFFEMLGNWSFGDYFKDEAIAWAWEFLTGVMGLPEDRFYATYFEGNKDLGLEPDTEARDFWLRFLPPGRVLTGNMKDNFWEMGDTGPCGPCSELHYDRVGDRDAAGLVNSDDPDVIELWNLVFIQYNRTSPTTLTALPAKHVDTGMGFERLVSVLQDVRSNYDTDVFLPIFAEIEHISAAPHQYQGRLGAADAGNIDTAYRVIADHIRTLTFAIADGATPSNEGRGYVLRRVLRRAVRYGRQTLNAKQGFLAKLVPTVTGLMGEHFPELKQHQSRVQEIIDEEEASFSRTLERGLKLFDRAAASGAITGEDAFKLHDTYGFPIDLTTLMADERGLRVDTDGYHERMEEAKELARSGAKFGAADAVSFQPEHVARLESLRVKPTDDQAKFDPKDITASVVAIFAGSSFVTKAGADPAKRIAVILDRTNFYAEMGGQVADHGHLSVLHDSTSNDRSGQFRVENVRSTAGYVLHTGKITKGHLCVGDHVQCVIDHTRRDTIASNHTATHLLNQALREVLAPREDDPPIDQRGSLVAPDRLRFDFSYSKPVDPSDLGEVERVVRERVESAINVHTDSAPLDLAKAVAGLRAVFGETYPNPVRVVSIGVPVAELLDDPTNDLWKGFSVEFCGGTHVANTSQIQHFALIQEEAVAKGVRRVVALTGVPAQAANEAARNLASRIQRAGQLDPADLKPEVTEIAAEIDQLTLPAAAKHHLRGELARHQETLKKSAKAAEAKLVERAVELARRIVEDTREHDRAVIVSQIELGSSRPAIQAALSAITSALPETPVMLFSPDPDEGKIAIIAACPANAVQAGLKAGDWLREAARVCGGKGGGKPDQAQGGGTELAKLQDAATHALHTAREKLAT